MDFFEKNLGSNDLSPVFLGYSAYTNEISRQFFHRYRLISHVFCERVPFFRQFSMTMKFHTVRSFTHDELILTALEDFADTAKDRDVILCLISGTMFATELISRHRERLESRFVIADTNILRNLCEIPSLQ